MRVIHVAAHLGGGVGKAHAEVARYLPADVERTFLLTQEPEDRRHVRALEALGTRVVVTRSPESEARLMRPDVVQHEYWGHDSAQLFRVRGAATVAWSHRSGYGETSLPPSGAVDHLVLTTAASLLFVSEEVRRGRASVVNSGFGYRAEWRDRGDGVTYLGTVDFKKMNEFFFSLVDQMNLLQPVSVWGRPSDAARQSAAMMRRPWQAVLCGHTDHPKRALEPRGIFLYPLRPDHYGTAENALVEAMSLGLVPVCLDNPAEREVVAPGAGFLCKTIAECAERTLELSRDPNLRVRMSRAAWEHARETRDPGASASALVDLWRRLVKGRDDARAA